MAGKTSTVKKGNYYKYKTKKWFEDDGYYSEYLEKKQRIFTKGRVIFINRDLAGADGFAMNKNEIIFWQCKLNKTHISDAIKEFNKYPFPDCVKRWIVVWEPRARAPHIVDVNEIEVSSEHDAGS